MPTKTGAPGRERGEAAAKDSKAKEGAGDETEVRAATPARTPGQGADGSPNSDEATKDGGGANEAPARTPAAARAVSSPTTLDVDVPTPRGIDQMSPDGNREYKLYKDVECCFCGEQRKFNGYLAFKKHVVSYCSAKPESTFDTFQRHVEKYWNDQPAMDQAEMVSAFVMEDKNDDDETEGESDDDDDGPRSDTVKQRAEAEATNDADSDDDRPANKTALLKTPENLFDSVLDVDGRAANASNEPNRKRRTAARPSRYSAGVDDDERAVGSDRDVDDSTKQEYACAECRKSFKSPHSLRIHQSRMKHRGEAIAHASAVTGSDNNKTQAVAVVTNDSTFCDVCGDSFKTSAGLATHKSRWCKGKQSAASSVPNAPVATKAKAGVSPKIVSDAKAPLQELSVAAKSRKCLLRLEHGCKFKGTTFGALVRHMRDEHGIKVTPTGKSSLADELPRSKAAVKEQSMKPQTETALLHIFHTQRTCTECSTKFSDSKRLITHYKDVHNIRAFISAKEWQEAAALMKSPTALPTSVPKPNKEAHETTDADHLNGKSKKTLITCEYCQTHTGFWGAGFAAHQRSCKSKSVQPALREDEPANIKIRFPGPPRTKEMDPGVRFCDECTAGDFKCKSFRQLCTHYKKEHNVELISAVAGAVHPATLNQTDMEGVDETEVDETAEGGAHGTTSMPVLELHPVEILSDQLKCPECAFEAKQHRGLCTHIRMKHKMIPISLAPPKRRKRPRAVEIPTNDETRTLVPVKRMTREMNGALTGSETVDAKNFQQLVNSLKELSAAHKELLRSHEELARSHEIATRTSIQYEDRIAMLESSSSQGGNRRRGAAHGALASCTPDAKTQVIYHNPDGLDCSPVVTWGRHVWLSGITCGSVVEPTFAGQMRVVFDNLVRLLVMAGTDVAHLLQVKVHLKDIREMEAVCDVWDKFFSDAGIARERRPSRHITQAALSNAKLQVEMFAEAVLPGEGERAFPSGVPPKRIASA